MSEFDKDAYCEAAADDTATAICASFDYTDAAVGEVASGLDVFYLLFAGAMVFFMQSGFAMLCAGSIRQKVSRAAPNAKSTGRTRSCHNIPPNAPCQQ